MVFRCSTTKISLLSVAFAAMFSSATSAHQKNIYSEAECHPLSHPYQASILRITNLEGTSASGVVIAKNRVLTVAHVLDTKPIYADIEGVFIEIQVLARNDELDLAYLSVDTQSLPSLEMSASLPQHGESVWAAGFPLAKKLRVSTGFFQSVQGNNLHTSVHINQGSSGGALMRCENGVEKLVGVVKGYIGQRQAGKLINIGDSTSVSINSIRAFIAE